jgi:hypothetical protein
MPRLSQKNPNVGKTKKKPNVRQLVKKLDQVFSLWVRQREADFNGYNSCFTCGVTKPWKELQAGHYVSRSHKSTRFHERNVWPQCVGCNIFKHGAMDSYALALQRKYGASILEELNGLKHLSKSFTVQELQSLIDKYKG